MQGAPVILIHIAQCESHLRQYDDSGAVLTNATHDYGYFQINKLHIAEAKKLGFDIMTPEGNIGFALYLYHKEGTTPWNASKYCWGGTDTG